MGNRGPVPVPIEPVPDSTETGSLGVVHVKRLWSRAMLKRAGHLPARDDGSEGAVDRVLIHGLGLNLLETYQYLYGDAPTFELFERWILEKNGGTIARERVDRINAAVVGKNGAADYPDRLCEIDNMEPVLSEADLAFWEEHGYVVLHEAVAAGEREAAACAIWEFLGMDPENSETWYRGPQGHSIMVPIVHHPAFWANRNSPRIHKAFAQLWGTSDLWVSIDRGGFNPPERPDWRFPGPQLHWDTSLALPIPFDVQGILYLTDTAADQGAFTCVPGFHRRIQAWLESLPAGANPRSQDLDSLGAVPIAGKAGDLVIWHQALPHGSSPNRACQPRMVQYISMYPSDRQDDRPWI